jgi:hypothetical protein
LFFVLVVVLWGVVVVLVFLWGVLVGGRSWLVSQGINPTVVLVGNMIVWGATMLSLFVLLRGERTAKPQTFVRSMYASFMLRFFLILIAAFAYIMTAKKEVNKPALMILGGLYILYAALEISAMMRSLKNKRNAQERSSS